MFLVLMVLLLASCGDRLTEKVINTYDNGQPETVQLVDRKGVSQHEIRYYKDGTMLMEGDVKDDKWDGEWKAFTPMASEQASGPPMMNRGMSRVWKTWAIDQRSSFIFSMSRRSFLVGRPAPLSRYSDL